MCKFGIILYRLVECPHPCGGESERYYLESSGIIPIESSESPIVALFMATILTTLRVLPDLPTVPDADVPTPYTVNSPTNASQIYRLVIPHSLASGGHRMSARLRALLPATHVHFDVRGFVPHTIFALDPFITPTSPPTDSLKEAYKDWADGVLARRERPLYAGECQVFSREAFRAMLDSPATVRLDEMVGYDPSEGMVLRGRLNNRPVYVWCSPVRIEGWAEGSIDRSLSSRALLYRTNLAPFQGKLVPHFLGLYLTENWSISVIEDPGTEIYSRKVSEDEKCVVYLCMARTPSADFIPCLFIELLYTPPSMRCTEQE
jgi:hypothetical protein